MKRLVVIGLLLLAGATYGQTKEDYERTVQSFMAFYNLSKSDSICNLFSNSWGERKKLLFPREELQDLHAHYGQMMRYDYIGFSESDSLTVFKVKFTKVDTAFAMGLLLDDANKMLTFQFYATSPEIDYLMKNGQ
jgi:hypothetical protein